MPSSFSIRYDRDGTSSISGVDKIKSIVSNSFVDAPINDRDTAFDNLTADDVNKAISQNEAMFQLRVK